MIPREQIEAALPHFTGTSNYTRHGLMRNLLLTDGVRYVRENADAYWLVDAIASHMATNRKLKNEPFQVWDFERHGKDIAEPNRPHVLSVTDGNSKQPIVTQEIEYTDFPLESIRFYAAYDGGLGGWVLMLPSEY